MRTAKRPRSESFDQSLRMSRRAVLRGLGALVCLPGLETFAGAESKRQRRSASNKVRMAYLYFPNGVAEGAWDPASVGKGGELLELNEWMRPLEAFKSDIVIPTNVWTPRGNGHGAGTATWLTGQSYDHREIDAGSPSVDQIAARAIGEQTLLPSLELSLRGEGHFSKSLPRNTLSWIASGLPAAREVQPRAVFDRMFRGGETSETDKSVLDLVRDQLRRLRGEVGRTDQRKVDEYVDAVRAIERRISFAEEQSLRVGADGALTDSLTRPKSGIPADHQEYTRIMLDLIVLAFWSDATRVCSFMLDHGQSNRYFNFVDGVKGTWHALSHYRDVSGKTEDDDGKTAWSSLASKRDMYNAVTRWHHEQLAYLLKRMKEVDDGDGTLLDNSMVLYGSSLSDGHEHGSKNLPLILAGHGGKTIRSGRQIRFRDPESLSKLHLAMLQRVGADVDSFADSDTPMGELDARMAF